MQSRRGGGGGISANMRTASASSSEAGSGSVQHYPGCTAMRHGCVYLQAIKKSTDAAICVWAGYADHIGTIASLKPTKPSSVPVTKRKS